MKDNDERKLLRMQREVIVGFLRKLRAVKGIPQLLIAVSPVATGGYQFQLITDGMKEGDIAITLTGAQAALMQHLFRGTPPPGPKPGSN